MKLLTITYGLNHKKKSMSNATCSFFIYYYLYYSYINSIYYSYTIAKSSSNIRVFTPLSFGEGQGVRLYLSFGEGQGVRLFLSSFKSIHFVYPNFIRFQWKNVPFFLFFSYKIPNFVHLIIYKRHKIQEPCKRSRIW